MEKKVRYYTEKSPKRIIINVLLTLLAALISTIALWVFVYPFSFVPLGLEAVVTILYKIFPQIGAGWYTLILNAPLVIIAFFKLKPRYVLYSLLFTAASFIFLEVWSLIELPQNIISTDQRLLAAIFAGIMLGARTALMLMIGSSTGGADIIAAMVLKKLPGLNVERVISLICLIIIAASYFVYREFESLLLSVVQMIICEISITYMMRGSRQAIEVTIITKHPEAVREDIINNLRHSATIVNGKGMYKGDDTSVILSVLNVSQLSELFNVIKKYPDTFVYYTEVKGVLGNFRRRRDEEVK